MTISENPDPNDLRIEISAVDPDKDKELVFSLNQITGSFRGHRVYTLNSEDADDENPISE